MLEIKNKIEFEDNCYVGLVKSSLFNTSKEARIKAVTDIASICMGRLGFKETPISAILDGALQGNSLEEGIKSKRLRLYNRLLKESGGKPSTPFEFIPVKIEVNQLRNILGNKYMYADYVNKILKYSYYTQKVTEPEYILSNLRVLLKAGIDIKDIPFNTPEEVEGFKVIIGKFPKVAFDHIIRSRSLSPNAESSRNKKYLNEVEFHYPSEWDRNENTFNVFKYKDGSSLGDLKSRVECREVKPEDATKELSCRRLMLSVWSSWIQDENSWDNLFNTRAKGSGAQEITGKVVYNIKKLINGK